MENVFDAIIIGAGPAGGTAGILLAGAGWRVAIVDKDNFPREKVCGGCIAASNLPLLEALGISDRFFSMAGPPLRQMALICQDRIIHAPLPPYADSAYPWGVAMRRAHLDLLLLDRARHCGATIFQPWLATSIEGSAGHFRCHIRKTGAAESLVLSAPLLIDAHGSWQALQQDNRERQSHGQGDLLAFKADFTGTGLEQGVLPVLSFPGGYGGMVVTDHGAVTIAFCIQRRTLAQARAGFPGHRPQESAAQWVMSHCEAVRQMLHGAAQETKWVAAGPIHPGIRIGQASQSAFPVGNAAGETHPIIGEGVSMALQSAVLLADLIAPHKEWASDPRWQATMRREYASAWRGHFTNRIRLAALFAHTAMRPAMCRSLFPLLQRYPGLLSQFARWSGKVRPGPRSEDSRIVWAQ